MTVNNFQENMHYRNMSKNMGKIKAIHFVGIGGAGMSGIAELLHNIGYQVSGSDIQENKMTQYLQGLNLTITIGHHPENCLHADVVVRSSAISVENVEIKAAIDNRIPVIPRAEMLAEMMRFRYGIAVAGTHGKTTTTSLVASILAQAQLDPTFVIGGKLNSAGTHARLGEGPYLVAEADESDASFLHLQPLMAIITNMEADHMDTYAGDFNQLKNTFIEFIQRMPFYGLAIICSDDENIRSCVPYFARSTLSYGIQDKEADYYAYDIQQKQYTTTFRLQIKSENQSYPYQISMPGKHNVLNALAAIIVARELDIAHADIQQALIEFSGIGRRFQSYGEKYTGNNQNTFLLIDDYAHHPSELRATIQAVRDGWPQRRLVVVFQPHRYTRTRDLYDDFVTVLSQVDYLILMDVYAAGEDVIAGADSRNMIRSIRSYGTLEPVLVHDQAELELILSQQLNHQDILLTMGAGSIGNMAAAIGKKFEPAE